MHDYLMIINILRHSYPNPWMAVSLFQVLQKCVGIGISIDYHIDYTATIVIATENTTISTTYYKVQRFDKGMSITFFMSVNLNVAKPLRFSSGVWEHASPKIIIIPNISFFMVNYYILLWNTTHCGRNCFWITTFCDNL